MEIVRENWALDLKTRRRRGCLFHIKCSIYRIRFTNRFGKWRFVRAVTAMYTVWNCGVDDTLQFFRDVCTYLLL